MFKMCMDFESFFFFFKWLKNTCFETMYQNFKGTDVIEQFNFKSEA
jgi:hypothetical protein